LLIVVSFVLAERNYRNEFNAWAKKHGKTYTGIEIHSRFNKWKRNLHFVEAHNQRTDKTYTMAMNHFGDLSHEEFKTLHLSGLKFNLTQFLSSDKPIFRSSSNVKDNTVDWRDKGVVTPVKNQGQCGGCYSFSATGAMEGCDAIKTGKLNSLSEQNILDCSSSFGNQGCNGGLMNSAFDYVISNKGIDSEKSYPYEAKDDKCRFNAANVAGTITGYTNVASGNENSLTSAITSAPVSVAIDASHNSFQFYQTGVYYEPQCSSTALDHGVLAVGYGTESDGDYYIVKNSWGADWGQAGYIFMARGRNNNCGIATASSFPQC